MMELTAEHPYGEPFAQDGIDHTIFAAFNVHLEEIEMVMVMFAHEVADAGAVELDSPSVLGGNTKRAFSRNDRFAEFDLAALAR